MVKKYKNSKAGEKIIKTYDELLSKWGCDLIERDIKTSYGTTHVIETGNPDGRPLVLFHGVGDDSALMWIYNAKKLGEHYKLYAVDTIGGPGKSIPNENYNRDFDDIRWIDEILQGLGLEKAVFAGVSHGAYLVQAYTMNRPEKVEQGISISGTVPLGGKKGLEIAVRGDLTLLEAHAIAESVHADVEKGFPNVKHVMVHVNPLTKRSAV